MKLHLINSNNGQLFDENKVKIIKWHNLKKIENPELQRLQRRKLPHVALSPFHFHRTTTIHQIVSNFLIHSQTLTQSARWFWFWLQDIHCSVKLTFSISFLSISVFCSCVGFGLTKCEVLLVRTETLFKESKKNHD